MDIMTAPEKKMHTRKGVGSSAVIGCNTWTPDATVGAGDAWVATGALAP